MEDGTVMTWGWNSFGQLGIGNTTNQLSPVVGPGLSGVNQLVAGGAHSLALMNDGTVKAWGFNSYGQLGIGNNTNRLSPTEVPGLSNANELVVGDYHSFVITNNSNVMAWGYNANGELGLGDTVNRLVPTTMTLEGFYVVDEEAQQFLAATEAVITAETSKSQSDCDAAMVLIETLASSTEKSKLMNRLNVIQSIIDEATSIAEAITIATEAVAVAETSKTQADVDAAMALANALPDSPEKTALLERLSSVDTVPIVVSQQYKVADTKINLAMSLPREPYLSLALLSIEQVMDPVEKATLSLEMQVAIEKSTAIKPVTTKTANMFVRLAEITGRDKYILLAEEKTALIVDSTEQLDAVSRIDGIKSIKTPSEQKAYNTLIAAEQWKSPNMITAATKLINALEDGTFKTDMLDRISILN